MRSKFGSAFVILNNNICWEKHFFDEIILFYSLDLTKQFQILEIVISTIYNLQRFLWSLRGNGNGRFQKSNNGTEHLRPALTYLDRYQSRSLPVHTDSQMFCAGVWLSASTGTDN